MRIQSAAVACFLLIALAFAHPAVGGTLTVPDAFTPVLVRFVGDDSGPVKGSDGRWHVVYELWLTNAQPVPAGPRENELPLDLRIVGFPAPTPP